MGYSMVIQYTCTMRKAQPSIISVPPSYSPFPCNGASKLLFWVTTTYAVSGYEIASPRSL